MAIVIFFISLMLFFSAKLRFYSDITNYLSEIFVQIVEILLLRPLLKRRFASSKWKRSFQTLEAMLLPIGSLPSRLWKQGL